MLHESRTLLLLHATSCMKYRKTKLNAHSNIHYPTLLHRTCNKVASYMMGFMHTYISYHITRPTFSHMT